jgi:hypothetical protein
MKLLKLLRELTARLALIVAGCLVGLFLAEGILVVRSLVKYGWIGREKLIAERRELRDDVQVGRGNRDENRQVLHPFFGYTYNPKDQDINNFGFWAKYDISLQKSGYFIKDRARSDHLVIGIFGGSFAGSIGGEPDYLEKRLGSLFPGKKPVVMNFAIGGHALPQSALIYVYFKDLLDVVVFIDGLNELWNYVDNNKAGVPPEYAKAAHYLYKISREELNPFQFERTAEIISLRRKIDSITALSLRPVIRQSLLVHHIWKVLQAKWSQRIGEASQDIVRSYEEARPKFFNLDDDAVLNHAATHWGRYHRLIHHLAALDGVLSVHFLQPNPFVAGSKVLTKDEDHRVNNSFPIKPYVENGYPKLRAEISKLLAEGVHGEDLTGIFKSVNETVWIDSAHLNDKGRHLIADKVVDFVRANRELISRERRAEPYPANQGAGKLSR